MRTDNTIKMELQKLFQNQLSGMDYMGVKNYLVNNCGLVVKEDKNHPQLYLITQRKDPQPDASDQPFLAECHGIILEKETNRVICYTFNVGVEYDYDTTPQDLTQYGIDWSHAQVEESVEGTQLRLYYFQDQWIVSTVRCLDAERAYWHSQKSFADLFQETCTYLSWDTSQLNPQYCYALVLQHPENQIVVKYQMPRLVHVLTRDLSQDNYPEIDVDIGLPRPNVVAKDRFPALSDLLQEIKTYQKLDIEGYFVKSLLRRVKIMTDFYRHAKDLRGNITRDNFIYQFLILRQKGQISEYLKYFPEDAQLFRKMENKLHDMIGDIHRQYCNKFVNKSITMKDVTFSFRPFIYEVNGIHLQTKEIITRKRMQEELYKRDPAQIAFIYRSYYGTIKPKLWKSPLKTILEEPDESGESTIQEVSQTNTGDD